MNREPPKIFISYSHADEAWKDKLQKYLETQVQLNKLIVWDDRQIRTGDEWNSDIENSIRKSDIAILLVTVDFLNSSFIQDKEIPFIQKNSLKIMPIIISPCNWEKFEYISKPQGFTKNNQPLEGLSEFKIKEEFTRISAELCRFDRDKASTSNVNISHLQEIEAVLKENYPTTKKLKDALFEYLEKDNLGFKEILKTDRFDEVVELLFKYKKECIYCIFQSLGVEDDYVNQFETDSCDRYQVEVKNSRQIQKVILRIHQGSAGLINDCWAEGWLLYDIGILEPIEKLENIDFNSDYTTHLANYLNHILENYTRKYPLDIDLVLDDGIFIKGFQKFAVENQFNISIQFLYRNKNFFLPKKLYGWRDNSDFFEKKEREEISSYTFPIEEVYQKSSLQNCCTAQKIVVVSSHNLLTPQYLELIKKLGLPIVISPCSDISTSVDFSWGTDTLNSLRSKVIMALTDHYNRVDFFEKEKSRESLNEEKEIQFIYDNYHDVAKFKEIIKEEEPKLK